jgi:molybdopterin synthase catalytic subunit/molybdopterin synthase sulfur carrier subunit
MTINPSPSTSPVTLRVKLFAGLAAAAGRRLLELPWQHGTAADLKAAVADALPAVAAVVANSAVAIDNRYVDADTAIPSTADVAIIPPVSGG